jgi:myosin heavy subunit
VFDSLDKMLNPAEAATRAFDEQAKKVADLESELPPLLDRYKELTGKSELSKKEQDELSKVIARIGEITPGAITQVDEYGRVLGINAQKSREFLEAEKARLKFVNEDAINATEKQIQQLKRQQAEQKRLAEEQSRPLTTTNLAGSTTRNVPLSDTEITRARQNLLEVTTKLTGAEAELKRLRGEPIATEKPKAPGGDSNQEQDLKDQAAAEKAAKEREKRGEREAKERQKQLERLREAEQEFRQDEELARLDDDARKLREEELRYNKQIALAKELETAGVKGATEERLKLEELKYTALETLRQQQREDKQVKLDEEAEEEIQKEFERLTKQAEERVEVEKKIQEFINENTRTELENQLIEAETQYQSLLALAEKYGLDTINLEAAYQAELARIKKEAADKDLAEQKKSRELIKQGEAQLAEARLGVYQDVAAGLGEIFGDIEEAQIALFAFNKILAAAEVIVNLQKELATINATYAALPPVAAALSTKAIVRSSISLATIGATTVIGVGQRISGNKKAKQRKEGRWLNVTGEDDNITYNAKYIGQPLTGMLPDHPVLISSSTGQPVLASERGREYFVSNTALDHPVVLNHVRAIDNIVRAKQMQDGGFTTTSTAIAPTPSASTLTAADMSILVGVKQSLDRLNTNLENGIYAMIDNDFIRDLREQERKLGRAAGG